MTSGDRARGRRAIGVAALCVALAGAAALASGAPGPAARSGAGDDLRLVHPRDGKVINRGTWVVADYDLGLVAAEVKRMTFTYEEVGGDGTEHRIRAGAPKGNAPLAALWDTLDVEPGDYRIGATLVTRDGARHEAASREVHVNGQPTAIASVAMPRAARAGLGPASARRGSGGAHTEVFDGSGSFDGDGTVTGWHWDFGDGTTGSGETAEHVYTEPGSYGVTLTATDDQGGRRYAYHTLVLVSDGGELVRSSFEENEGCGCQKMTVNGESGPVPSGLTHAGGQSSVPAAAGQVNGPYNDGEAGDRPRLNLRKAAVTVACRFQVTAELVPGSAPPLCPEGQKIQATLQVDQRTPRDFPIPTTHPFKSGDPRYDPTKSADDPYDDADDPNVVERTRCGFENADHAWCDDDYHGGGGADGSGAAGQQPPQKGKKLYEGQSRISWLDAPGFNNAPGRVFADSDIKFRFKFRAAVGEQPNACLCGWTVVIHVVNGRVMENRIPPASITPECRPA